MKSFSSLTLLFLVSHAMAQVTVTEYVTVAPSRTPTASADSQHKQASSTTTTNPALSTFATSLRSTSSAIIQATSVASPSASTMALTSSNPLNNNSEPGSTIAVDTNAGASGSDNGSSFDLSQGGTIAIIVVVVIVAILGIASTILFVLAKRRQWNIRASIARASRRLTGRSGGASGANANRRTTVQGGRFGGLPTPGPRAGRPFGHEKRDFAVNTRDVEKGPLDGRGPQKTRPRENTWVRRLWGNDWK